ncbi:hypothetical protein [Aeromicrobium sp. CTD01-1L150]|uniref:hypothetical protein n=1 Tax=Aeromicrobium sp. CTD01-1L150 TaxID=3341830 RepID=UPI0035BED9CA
MSGEERPARRRRIAGEGTPSTDAAQQPARRVVKRPVVRPGAAKASSTSQDVPLDRDAPDDLAETGDDPEGVPQQDVSEREEAPRIVPAGWRRGRSRSQDERAGEDTLEPDDLESPGEGESSRTASGLTPSRARLRTALAVLVVVLALVFAVVASYWAVQKIRGGAGLEAAQAEAAAAASTASEQILGYRYDRLDEHLENAQALMTDDFAEEFESISPALDDLAPQRQIVVEATARDAAAMPCGGDCSRDAVDVLVFIDQARVADGDDEPTVFGNRIALSMVKSGGDWLVDDIEAY